MYNASDLRNGTTFELDGKPYVVVRYTHTKMGRGGATIRVEARNLRTGSIEEKTFGSSDRVDSVPTARRKMQYLYSDLASAIFMDPISFEQIEIPLSAIHDEIKFLKDGEQVNVLMVRDEPLLIELAPKITLTVADTGPGVRGNSTSNIWKSATLENGLQTKVPLFVRIGEKIRVDTRTGEYVERAKD